MKEYAEITAQEQQNTLENTAGINGIAYPAVTHYPAVIQRSQTSAARKKADAVMEDVALMENLEEAANTHWNELVKRKAVKEVRSTTSRQLLITDPFPMGGSYRAVKAYNAQVNRYLRKEYRTLKLRREANHIPPKSVYPSGTDLSIDDMPAHSIWKFDHRVEKDHVGDGATGTGSSSEAVEYRQQLQEKMADGDFDGAFAMDLNDILNTPFHRTNGINREYYLKGLLAAYRYAKGKGLINGDNEGQIKKLMGLDKY